jgi:hypothetical protein
MDDRTIAIIIGAMLDHSLERLLLAHIVHAPKESREDRLFGTGPLGSFFGKIQIGLAFGVIEPSFADDLDIIRDIRNAFSHASQRVTFLNKSIQRRVRQLHGVVLLDTLMRAIRSPVKSHFNNTRGRFILSAIGYVKALDEMRTEKKVSKTAKVSGA